MRFVPVKTVEQQSVMVGSGHYRARELGALGHDVRLMAPSYVKPYVKRQKNDAFIRRSSRCSLVESRPRYQEQTWVLLLKFERRSGSRAAGFG
jgi:transposase